MAVAHDEATMELIKARLSNSERPLIRLLRTFYKLSTLSSDDKEQLQICHATFLVELQSLTRSLSESKGIKMLEMTELELSRLADEKARLEDEATKERERISQLEIDLEQARRERRNKIQYEEIGKEVRRFSDRFQSADRINGLAREIDSLLEEQGFYAERWASRRAQFDTVISNLEVLQESIKEEKADADRKKALNDDESDVENMEEPEPARPEQDGEATDALGTESKKASALNPTASAFLPNLAVGHASGTSTPDGRARPETSDPSENAGTTLPSEGLAREEPMEIDHQEEEAGQDSREEEGLVKDEATMEDGEEIEEAEEGQEMEHD